MATTGETPTLFLRKATGLVKGWNAFDAFVYAFMSVNLVTLGMYFSLSVLPFVPDGQVIPAILLSAVGVSFLVVTYAGLIAAMPRAGGDYVWQSRVLSGGVAFVLSVTGWWFILWHWAPIYGNILTVQILQPLAALLGFDGLVSALVTKNGVFIVSLLTILLAGYLVSLGMEGYARVQKACFSLAIVGLVVMFAIMLFGSRSGFESAFNQEAASLFGTSGNVYRETIRAAAEGNGISMREVTLSPFFGSTLLLVPFMLFWILYPNWGATLYGEVRGAGDFKRVFNGMFWGLWITAAMSIVFVLLAAKTFGWEFFNAANANYWFAIYGSEVAPTIPIWPYPPLLASFYVHNRLFQILMVLVFGAWFVGWAGTLFLSSTRVIFAAAFDRILPEWAANVSEKRHVPTGALLLMFIPSIVISALYAYWGEFVTYTLDATLVIAVTYFGSAVAATILPWRRPAIYENSPVSRYRIGGVPLITVAGVLTVLFLGWAIYKWLFDRLYGIGIGNPASLVYLGILYGIALLIYIVARVVRRQQGIDLTRIHQEIPAE
ncbi:MAG TPA: APC family permease [Actinomycetota bacterium]|nr:APC family permease [Actinomycetota bacterium]